MTTFMEPAAAEAEIQSNVAAIRAMKTVSGPPFPACGFSHSKASASADGLL